MLRRVKAHVPMSPDPIDRPIDLGSYAQGRCGPGDLYSMEHGAPGFRHVDDPDFSAVDRAQSPSVAGLTAPGRVEVRPVQDDRPGR
jgi:hypothetical protein